MRSFAVWPICLVAGLLLAGGRPCAAQAPIRVPDADRPAAIDQPAGTAARSAEVREVQPPVLYLRTKDGLQQAVLGFTLEDFERLQAQRAQLNAGQQPPSFRVEKLTCTGRAEDKHAVLSIQLRVAANGKNWVRVPIGLGELAINDKPKFDGPGQHFLEFDEKGRQYVAWFRGLEEQPIQVTLDGLAPLSLSAGRTTLKISAPRAAASTLVLTVPLPSAAAETPAPAILTESKAVNGATEFRAAGLDADFAISWRDTAKQVGDAPSVLETTGSITATIDGRRTRCDARLSVSSVGGPLDRFRVRLPKGAALVGGEGRDYSVTAIDDGAKPQAQAPSATLYEVRLREKTTGPVTVRLVTERPHAAVDGETRVEMGGPDVVGAIRQSGYLAIRVQGDWQAAFESLERIRQVEDLPQDLVDEDVVAGFEYTGVPFALAGRVVPRRSHRTVESRYTARVEAHQVRLDVDLTYRVRGGKAFELEVDLPGWHVDEVGPRSLLDVDRAVVQPEVPLRVPLLQPSTGEIPLTIRAHRTIGAAAARVEFSLPKPSAETLGSAELTVVPADNVRLAPLAGSVKGLWPAADEGTPRPSADARRAWRYRVEGADAAFVADLRVESRLVRASVTSQASIEDRLWHIEQTLDYVIENEPLDRLLLDLPLWWDDAVATQATIDGKPVELSLANDDETTTGRKLQFSVPLGQPRLGSCQLRLSYFLPQERIPDGASSRQDLPLLMPGDGELVDNRLSIIWGPGISVRVQDELWSRETSAAPRRDEMKLVSSVATSEVALIVSAFQPAPVGPTVVERAWIQSWLGRGRRQDRAVYQFTSHEPRIGLRLPPDTQPAQAIVLLDGAQQPVSNGADNRIWIDLPTATASSDRHVLEVTYRFSNAERPSGRLPLEAPLWDEGVGVRHTFWQLVLPRDDFLLLGPVDLNGEFAWTWRGLLWSRRPLRDQSSLEAWSGARHEAPPHANNQYLFSAPGPIATLEVRTAGRSWLVLWASGAVLLGVLMLLYVPSVRRPGALCLVAIALVAAAALLPDFALLATQAAALGAVLALGGMLLHGALARRQRRAVFIRSTGSSLLEPPSTKTQPKADGDAIGRPAEPAPAEVQALSAEGPP